jgi:hypothetical protein
MILVARDHQNGAVVATGIRAVAGDLPRIVDLRRLGHITPNTLSG